MPKSVVPGSVIDPSSLSTPALGSGDPRGGGPTTSAPTLPKVICLPLLDARGHARRIGTCAATLREVLGQLTAKTEQADVSYDDLARLVEASVLVSREALEEITNLADGTLRELAELESRIS
jgi:hypothetical protein